MYTFSRKGKKGSIRIDKGMRDAYQYYCDHYENKYNITQQEYSQIFKEVMERIMFRIIFEAAEIKLYSVGNLRIKKKLIHIKFKPDGTLYTKNLRVDWKSTKELWAADEEALKNKQCIYHFNEHTDRYNLKFYYDKRTSNMRNQTAYQFRPARKWRRLLNEAVKRNPNLNYYE